LPAPGTPFANRIFMNQKRARILLVGRDPIFAWALEQKLTQIGCVLEHVYTIPEARCRLKRSEYAALLADGVERKIVDLLALDCAPECALLVVDDIYMEVPFQRPCDGSLHHALIIPKESALQLVVSTLENSAQR
jgi:hypothetical protein